MCQRALALTLALIASAPMLPAAATAQGPTAVQASALLRLEDGTPLSPAGRRSAPFVLPDSAVRRKDYTVTGLLIGAGLGFAAGWAFYDVICEAVDNRCSNSRLGYLIPGTALGGLLGALAGGLAD